MAPEPLKSCPDEITNGQTQQDDPNGGHLGQAGSSPHGGLNMQKEPKQHSSQAKQSEGGPKGQEQGKHVEPGPSIRNLDQFHELHP